ncbi:ribbon-helix-helix protein, CopG family [Allocoleopsis franciscana]
MLPQETIDQLRQLSARTNKSCASIIREALANHLKQFF